MNKTNIGAAEALRRERLVKLKFSDREIQALRVAAAVQNLRVGEFARTTLLATAKQVIEGRFPGGGHHA